MKYKRRKQPRCLGVVLCAALVLALAACAYQGYELPPEEETSAYTTGRLVLMVEDLAMPISQVEYTQWTPAAEKQPPAAQPSQGAQESQASPAENSVNPTTTAPQATAAPQGPPQVQAARYHTGISIMPPSIAELRAFLAANPTKYGVGYLENGSLDARTRQGALNHLNSIRYIAGVPANVTWDDAKTGMAEAAAVVMVANGGIDHHPARPAGIPDDVFRLAAQGAAASNLAISSAFDVINGALRQYLADSESSNLPTLGHRRWLLNPALGKTAFGAMGAYCVMTVQEFSNAQAGPEHSVVMYPGQVTPVSFFANSWPWSVSFSGEYNVRNAEVSVVRRSDNASWRFGKSRADGVFHINTAGFGQPNCVIFRPAGLYIQIGDIFDVQLTGVTRGGGEWLVQYTVQFI